MSSLNIPYPSVRRAPQPRTTEQSGFGMIEVLVALLILAIGLLGMASLQTTSLKLTSGSENRTQAIFLADDLIERIRANRENRNAYAVNNAAAQNCDTEFTIDNGNVVTDDLAEWGNSLACLLPGGDGSVQVNGDVVTVGVTWTDREDNDDIEEGELEVEVHL